MKKNIDLIFVLIVSLILLSGLVKTIAAPISINEYENRKAYRLSAPTAETFADGTFQQDCDNAFSDQIFFAIDAKKTYNRLRSGLNAVAFAKAQQLSVKEQPEEEQPVSDAPAEEPPIEDASEDVPLVIPPAKISGLRYFAQEDGRLVMGDHLMYPPRFWNEEKEKLDLRIVNINQIIDDHPQLEAYAFYIEKETDADFSTGEKTGIYEYLQKQLHLDRDHFGGLRIWDFETFDEMFYKSDHHWNHNGSYEGYKALLSLLLPEAEAVSHEETPILITQMHGSKATGASSNYQDDVYAFEYLLPEYTIQSDGQLEEDYGTWKSLIEARKRGEYIPYISYGMLYGPDSGELIIDNPASEGGSILIFGESYDNAVLKLLASHYSRIYSIDQRYYSVKMEKTFSLDAYLQQHPDIDRILFVGNIDYFVSDVFHVE